MTKAAIIILFLVGITSHAQDGHYWTQQYGTKSMLLSGSVIGGVEDLGAVYYNPGRLAVISNPAFLLSGNVYEYSSISISDAFGNSRNASKSELKGVPTLAAGTFHFKELPKHFFAYAILTRQQGDLGFAYNNEVHQDIFTSLPGEEYYGASFSVLDKSQETWLGMTWSYLVSPKFSFGITTNFSTNNQDVGTRIDMQVLSSNNEVAMYQYSRNLSYKQNGLIWKGGLAGTAGPWQLGLTITTPILWLSGNGNYNYEEFFSTIPGLSTRPEGYSSSYQKGLIVHTRTPWSVGAGATRNIGRNKIHLSTEWFGSVSPYTVMRAADHISQSNSMDTIRFRLTDKLKSVLNFGLGSELYISEKVSGFLSFSTDFTAVSNDITRFIQRQDEASNSSWNTDFYHVGGGIVLTLKGADITLGATHTGARETIPRPVSFPTSAGQSLFSSTDTAEMRWERWRLVFSFSFPFLKDYADRLQKKLEQKIEKN